MELFFIKIFAALVIYFLRLMVACNMHKERFKYEMRALRHRVLQVQQHWKSVKALRVAQAYVLELRFLRLEQQIQAKDVTAGKDVVTTPDALRRSVCKKALRNAIAAHVQLVRSWMADVWPFFYQSLCEEQYMEKRADVRHRAERMRVHGMMLPWLINRFGHQVVHDYPTAFSSLMAVDVYQMVQDAHHRCLNPFSRKWTEPNLGLDAEIVESPILKARRL